MKSRSELYRGVIDALVTMCRAGLGQVSAERARRGVWNRAATPEVLEDQHRVNVLLSRLSPAEREVLAQILSDAVETGVFETLKVLEEFEVAPFEDGYEGSAYNDFVGRLQGWDWPES